MSNTRLAIILLLAVAQATDSNSTDLPPPLPQSQWLEKSTLNYTALHETLGEALLCLDIPVGVLGFYVYTVQHLMIFLSIYLLSKEKTQSRASFLGSYVMCVFSLLLLVQQCKTLRSCSAYWHDVGRWSIPGLVVSCLCQLASVLSVYGTLVQSRDKYWNNFRICAMACYLLALQNNVLPGFLYLVGIMAAVKVKYIQWVDGVELDCTLAAVIPVPTLVLLLTIWYCIDGCTNRKRLCHFDGIAFAALVYVVVLVWTGGAFVFMGKIIGSPSGLYWLKHEFGKVDAAWITIFPLIQSILAIISGNTSA